MATLSNSLYQLRREALSRALVGLIRFQSRRLAKRSAGEQANKEATALPENPKTPEDFRPLENACFQYPYDFYRMLRDDYPVYQLPNGIFCISRYEDIVAVSRDVEGYSSAHQGAVAGLKPGQSIAAVGAQFTKMGQLGITPADVLATSDQPKHTTERKVGHSGLNARFVKSLESEVESLCQSMMDEFIPKGEVEFMQEFGWRLPMVLIIRLLGLPETDFEKIKGWCVHGINSQSGISSGAELATSRAEVIVFTRYCWHKFLHAKRNPPAGLMGVLVQAAADPETDFDDTHAVSTVFQLLIAGSDSSATSMGNALKMLIDNPDVQQEIRDDMDKLPAFVEEVFRLEAAFQGHFRWTKADRELHGIKLPKGSRVFLMWASGNRDDRFWDEPDRLDLSRKNGKKHLTFGHGIHACLGRELARMEIRIVLREFLQRTTNLKINGDAPFIASMFARTLLTLPISFDPKDDGSKATDEAA